MNKAKKQEYARLKGVWAVIKSGNVRVKDIDLVRSTVQNISTAIASYTDAEAYAITLAIRYSIFHCHDEALQICLKKLEVWLREHYANYSGEFTGDYFENLRSIAIAAMFRALDSFDPQGGISLENYIEAKINKALAPLTKKSELENDESVLESYTKLDQALRSSDSETFLVAQEMVKARLAQIDETTPITHEESVIAHLAAKYLPKEYEIQAVLLCIKKLDGMINKQIAEAHVPVAEYERVKQEACLQIQISLQTYDPKCGRLTTYLYPIIKHICHEACHDDGIVYSHHAELAYDHIKKAISELESMNINNPTDIQIAAQVNSMGYARSLSPTQVTKIREHHHELLRGDSLRDRPGSSNPEYEVESKLINEATKDLSDKIRKLVGDVSDDYRTLYDTTFGLMKEKQNCKTYPTSNEVYQRLVEQGHPTFSSMSREEFATYYNQYKKMVRKKANYFRKIFSELC